MPGETQLIPDDVASDELADAIRASLGVAAGEDADELFSDALSGVIRGIRNHGRFDLLKRFVTHGSLLPPSEELFENTPQALNDDELAFFVDFVSGHMVTKFQGCLAEILAAPEVDRLVDRWKTEGKVPRDAQLIQGQAIRCLPRHRSSVVARTGELRRGILGPDGLVTSEDRDGLVVHAIVEVKSSHVSPSKIEAQFKRHLAAVRRGVRIGQRWFSGSTVRVCATGDRGASRVSRVLVRPARWPLTRGFRLEPTESGSRRSVMREQSLPAATSTWCWDAARDWNVLTLAWSYDALRAAAFCLAHGYMAEVGEALAREPDPDIALRTDMSPAAAGPNDLLHQLHVAIYRQMESEGDLDRRRKTMELYNVLAFGWALGHSHRDGDGDHAMMYPEDLDDLALLPGESLQQ